MTKARDKNPDLVEKLRTAMPGFKKFIDFIVFPTYRNLENNARIEFTYPLTVLVGHNGSGKTSVLQALYGAPERRSVETFWFSTKTDPILRLKKKDTKGIHRIRHCYYYGYKDTGKSKKECLKTMISKGSNPEYWETSRPVLEYGMTKFKEPEGTRHPPIEMNVVYLNLRQELSAFERNFLFRDEAAIKKTTACTTIQGYLRKRSSTLHRVLEKKNIVRIRGNIQNEAPETIPIGIMEIISKILGKHYVSGEIVRHKFFGLWGFSVRFKTRFGTYTEAFSGSGETSTVRLIHAIEKAPDYSLVLIDEPEISLHPKAQDKIKQYLLKRCLEKKLQIVVSTHSANFIKGLPPDAIKLFQQNHKTGNFFIQNDCKPEDAFFHIGHTFKKGTIFVEDYFSKVILKAVIKKLGKGKSKKLAVRFLPGGSTGLLVKFIPIRCLDDDSNVFVVLDGDQKFQKPVPDFEKMTDKEKDPNLVEKALFEAIGGKVEFLQDGGKGGTREDQRLSSLQKYCEFLKEKFAFLPKGRPEEIIWDDKVAETMAPGIVKKLKKDVVESSKEKVYRLSKIAFGVGNRFRSTVDYLVQKWIEKNDKSFGEIKKIVEAFDAKVK